MKLISGSLKLSLLYPLFFLGLLFSSEHHNPIHNIPAKTAAFELTPSHLHRSVDYFSKIKNLNNITRQNRLDRLLQGLNTTPKTSDENFTPQSIYNPIKLQRHTIIERFLNNDPKTHEISFKQYSLNNKAQKYLSSHNIDIDAFQSCHGNLLQHAIHQEFIVLTDTTAHVWNQRINCQE